MEHSMRFIECHRMVSDSDVRKLCSAIFRWMKTIAWHQMNALDLCVCVSDAEIFTAAHSKEYMKKAKKIPTSESERTKCWYERQRKDNQQSPFECRIFSSLDSCCDWFYWHIRRYARTAASIRSSTSRIHASFYRSTDWIVLMMKILLRSCNVIS